MAEKNETIEFINNKALIITALFGLFGGALANSLEIPEMKLRYIPIACLLGLVLILLINFLLKVKNRIKTKQTLKFISIILFLTLLYFIYSFENTFQSSTFRYTDAYDSTGLYLKGNKAGLQPAASFFIEHQIKETGQIPSDQTLVDNFGGLLIQEKINNITKVWTEDSIKASTRKLATHYIIMAMLIIANIYFLSEILINFYKSKKKKPPNNQRNP